jgi:rubredoxin
MAAGSVNHPLGQCFVPPESGRIPTFDVPMAGEGGLKTYMCVICGFIYDEAKGLPEEGIAPGTKWEDVPLNWVCPECGAGKDDFELMEI